MLGLLLAAALQVQPPERVTPLPGVVLTFTLNQAAYEVGEPILVTLRLTNRSNALFLMPVSNEITGWYDGYGVEVRRADGRLVEDPLHRRMRVMSNIVVDHPIEPGRWRVRELTLNHRVPVLQPGRYSVKATYRELTPRYGSRSTESPTAWFQVVPTAPEKILARIARQRQQLLDDPDTAPAVARLFGFTGHADAIAPLVDLLYSPSLDAQVAAAEALLYLDRGQVKEALLEALQSRGPRSRMIHLLVVDMRPDADRLRALLLPWLSDRSELRRTATIQGLTLSNGANPDPRLFPRLVEMLRDPFPDVRQAAAVAVGAYLNAESLRALRPLVQDEDPDVKEQATIAVGWMALATKLPLAARQDAVDVLREVERGGGRAAEAARYWLSQAAAKGSVPSRR